MAKYCKLTGIDLAGDGATNGIKCMCLNCKSSTLSTEKSTSYDEQYVCGNEAVMELGKKKILASVPEGFEIDTLTLKPMTLKDPTKKCRNYEFDMNKVVEFLDGWFNPSSDSENENASD